MSITRACTDLVAFLNARLDEDEAAVRYASAGPWQATPLATFVDDAEGHRVAQLAFTEDGRHIARHDPARVLREVEAKRAILEWHNAQCTCSWCTADGDDLDEPDFAPACPTLCFLAAVYSDHPDYRQEWKQRGVTSSDGAP